MSNPNNNSDRPEHIQVRPAVPTAVIWRHLERDQWAVTTGTHGAGKDMRLIAVQVMENEPIYVSAYAPEIPTEVREKATSAMMDAYLPTLDEEDALAFFEATPNHPPFRSESDLTYEEMVARVGQRLGKSAGPYVRWLTENVTSDMLVTEGTTPYEVVRTIDWIAERRRAGDQLMAIFGNLRKDGKLPLALDKLAEHLLGL